MVIVHDGVPQVIVSGTNRVRSYEIKTGRVLWECGGQTVNAIPSPVQGLGNVYVASGYRGRAKSNFRVAVERVEKGLQYAYRDRRTRKRDFRALWIQRINAAAREHDLTYSKFINGLTRADVEIDRKVLADLAVREPEAFKALVEQARAGLAKD